MSKKQTPEKPRKKPERKSAKRISNRAKIKNNLLYTSVVLFVVVVLVGFGYFLGLQNSKQKNINKKELSPRAMFDKIEATTPTTRSDEAGFGVLGMIDKLQKSKQKSKHNTNALKVSKGKKPKLVIIIDDVSRASQLKTIKALPYHITPSIFPPSDNASHSNYLARGLKHYMVHLPMESGSAKMNKMRATLMVRDSASKMRARVKQIRKLFPTDKFINNHTGSVFTSNYRSMKLLYGMLKKEGFTFVDSKTTGKSKVRRIAKYYGDRYIVRDVFLDNTQTQSYIKKQLRKAVKIAKKRGHAIVIGHPHKSTMKALKNSKKLLSSVKVVYIDELYR